MDLEIDLDTLNSKKSEFESMKTNVAQIQKDFSGSYLNGLSSSDVGSVIKRIKESTDRLNKGYENSNSWFGRYVTSVTEVEDKLANFETSDTKTTEFKSEFIDIFSKSIIPILKTGYKADTNGLPEDIAAAKQAFIGGDVDDPSQYTIDPNYYNMTKHMRMFDNTTGQEIADRGELVLKKGETRVITVKLPTNTGMIGNIVRTTAADVETKVKDTYKITSSRSNLTGDMNNIQYVNYQYPHWPSDKSLLHNNTYDWIIHADETGARQISQTCEYTCSANPGWYAKAMVRINIKIVD